MPVPSSVPNDQTQPETVDVVVIGGGIAGICTALELSERGLSVAVCEKGIVDPKDPDSIKKHFDFGGELLIGHLRYGTSGLFNEGSCHPFIRRSNYPTKTLMVCGNFNMTNVEELFEEEVRAPRRSARLAGKPMFSYKKFYQF